MRASLRKIVINLVTLTALQSSIYSIFRRQCRRNSRRHHYGSDKPLKRLERFSRIVCWHYVTCIMVYISSILRSLLIILLGFTSPLSHFGLLDCFVIGRAIFPGRTNRVNTYLVGQLAINFTAYRVILSSLMPEHKFFVHEFILFDQDEVLENELAAGEPSDGVRARELGSRAKPSETSYSPELLLVLDNRCRQKPAQSLMGNPIFYLENPFSLSTDDDKYILRPCRTLRSWRLLNRFALMAAANALGSATVWLLTMGSFFAPAILTDVGFELNYPSCVRWLRKMQLYDNSTSKSSSFDRPALSNFSFSIYKPGLRLANDIPIDDLPVQLPYERLQKVTIYSSIRMLSDLLVNLFWYIDFIFIAISQAFVIYLMSIDLLINSSEIEARLKELIGQLRERLASQSAHGQYQLCSPGSRKMPELRLRAGPDVGQITRLQAIIVDHFLMVRGYNSFMAFFLLFCTLIWFSYTTICCIWMGSVKSRAVEMAFVISKAVTFQILFLMLTGAAITRSSNRRLYQLLATATALDANYLATKRHWLTVMNYYTPKPLYCFTFFDSIELSWLFCLKLVSWAVSALFVLASFVYLELRRT